MPIQVPRRLALFHDWTRLRCTMLYIVVAMFTTIRYWDRSDLSMRIAGLGTEIQILGYGRIMSKVYSLREVLGNDCSDFLLEYYLSKIQVLRGA